METISANKSAFSLSWIADQLVKNGITRQVNTGRWCESLPIAEVDLKSVGPMW